jgi:flagellin
MMRINNNIAALNAHRNLVKNNDVTNKTLERLSSGMKINRGADGPAALVISEKLRSQISGLRQAIDNSEAGISLMQTAEAALDEVSRSLINMRQLAVHAANEAVNDDVMLQADQEEIDNMISTVNRISKTAQYGKKAILDGSMGANGVTSGENLEFIEAGENTKASGVGGFKVKILEAAKRAEISGSIALNQEIIDRGEQITVEQGGKTITFNTMRGQTVETNLNALKKTLSDSNMEVDLVLANQKELENLLEQRNIRMSVRERLIGVHHDSGQLEEALANNEIIGELRDAGLTAEDIRSAVANKTAANEPQVLTLRHKKFGSDEVFSVTSTTSGLLGVNGDDPTLVENGKDVVGRIQGEIAFGKGQVLTGGSMTRADGLAVRYTGTQANAAGEFAGTVTVTQNSMIFQIGGNAGQTVKHSLAEMSSKALGRAVENLSGFRSLSDIDVTDAQGAQDAIRIIDKAIEEVSMNRASMGAFQKDHLQSNLNYLRTAHENVTNAESVIRDTDVAEEMAQYTRNQIIMEANVAMLAQANQAPNTLLRLLQ